MYVYSNPQITFLAIIGSYLMHNFERNSPLCPPTPPPTSGLVLNYGNRESHLLFWLFLIFMNIFPVHMRVSSPLDPGWDLPGEGN